MDEQPIGQPQYSPDGRWYWTGYEWKPAPEQATPQGRLRLHQQRYSTINWVLFGLGAAAVGFVVLLVLAGLAGVSQP